MTILVARVVCIARARRNMGKLTDAMKVFDRVERCDAAEWVLVNHADSTSILESRFIARFESASHARSHLIIIVIVIVIILTLNIFP